VFQLTIRIDRSISTGIAANDTQTEN